MAGKFQPSWSTVGEPWLYLTYPNTCVVGMLPNPALDHAPGRAQSAQLRLPEHTAAPQATGDGVPTELPCTSTMTAASIPLPCWQEPAMSHSQ